MFRAGAQVLWRVDGIAAKRGGGMPDPASSRNLRAKRDAIRMASATIASAWCGSTIIPTACTTIPLAFLTAAANNTW
jgi:hypothetical protein